MKRIKKFEAFGLALLLSIVMFMSGFGAGIYVANDASTPKQSKVMKHYVEPQSITIKAPSFRKMHDVKMNVLALKTDGSTYLQITSNGNIEYVSDDEVNVTLLTEIID